LFVLYVLALALSVLLRITDYDYPLGIHVLSRWIMITPWVFMFYLDGL
jgi:hypothetical protein